MTCVLESEVTHFYLGINLYLYILDCLSYEMNSYGL